MSLLQSFPHASQLLLLKAVCAGGVLTQIWPGRFSKTGQRISAQRETHARCARCARGAFVFHVRVQPFLSPCAVFCTSPLFAPPLFYILLFLFLRPSPGRGCGRPQPPLVRRMEWRPPLLCAYPLGHRVLATLKKCEKCRKGLVETHARCARGAQRGARGAYISLSVSRSSSLLLKIALKCNKSD